MNLFGAKFIGFAAPCNDVMLSIISLFMEILFLGALIMFIISFLLLYIYDCFGYKQERYIVLELQAASANGRGAYMYLQIRNILLGKENAYLEHIVAFFDLLTIFAHSQINTASVWKTFSLLGNLLHLFFFHNAAATDDFVERYFSKNSNFTELHCHNVPIYFTSEEESFLDAIFLIMPTIIILFLLIPTLGFLYNTDLDIDQISPAFGIDIIGHQWYWTYEYSLGVLGKEIVFDSIYTANSATGSAYRIDWLSDFSTNNSFDVDRHVVIPTNTNILLTITSTDVIHSWAVPKLGIKVDAVPGKLATTMLFTYVDGLYFGQCSELCGVYHGFMPICIEAVPSELFFSWCMITYYAENAFEFEVILID